MKSLLILCLFLVSSAHLLAKNVLVVGGAGFIGSHVNEMLHEHGYDTIVLDNLSQGHRHAVHHGLFVQGDMADSALLDQIFTTYEIDAVMHFAACIEAGESVVDPLRFYRNNVASTLTLLEAMHRHGVGIFIFSSTCAIFGTPLMDYVPENHPCHPINPYGQTKLMIETLLKDLDHAYGLRSCCLRYFNAAGGDPTGVIKNYKTKESALIPVILHRLKAGQNTVTIFGTDYPTPDGTCVRDFVHVSDLASAHLLAMEKLLSGAPSTCYNLGNGKGFSVREVIQAVEKVTGQTINVIEGPRRAGDCVIMVADSQKAYDELGWQPRYSALELMIQHAWRALETVNGFR